MSRAFFAFCLLYCCFSFSLSAFTDTSIPSTCEEAMFAIRSNGIYLLQIKDSNITKFYAYCQRDAKIGAPWLIIQRRLNGKVHFSGQSYKHGFGDLNGDHWLGLDLLHAITYSQRHEIWFHMQDFNNVERDAFYDLFIVGDEKSQYELKAVGKYTGNAGDSFSNNAGKQFLAGKICIGNGPCVDSCASKLGTGGWWFQNCSDSNLNGAYFANGTTTEKGINWHAWHGKTLKSVHMAIRPVKLF